MQAFKILFIISLIIKSLVNGSDYAHLRFLDKITNIMAKDQPFETIITFWHREDRTCTLQHWNPSGIPILRSNELGKMRMRGNFNNQALAFVCLTENSNPKLLKIVAETLETMRQERVILWTQRRPTKKFLEGISKQADKFQFTRVLVLEMGFDAKGVASMYRLNAFPTPLFARIRNISNIRNVRFYNRNYNFQGRKLIVKLNPDARDQNVQNATPAILPALRLEDLDIIEFAQKYNASVKVYDEQHDDYFDIQINPHFISMGSSFSAMDFAGPLSTSSLIIVVPCSSELTFAEVVKQLQVLTWLWYLLCVYGSFVLVESVILVVTYRITGVEHGLTLWNPLLNLRAFRAILGLPFPELRSASLSLRQLFLAITVFGFIFSNFFSCKLSALLTKPTERAQVRNFEELRASGMTMVTDEYHRLYIEREIDPEFFHLVIPNVITMTHIERVKLFLSFDKSFSYLVLSTNWRHFDRFQRDRGKRMYCESQDLVITERLPLTYVTPNNSFYKWPLSKFLMTIQEAGISFRWINDVIQRFLKEYKVKPTIDKSDAVPISFVHLSWLWYLLITGYGLATLTFLIEISLRNRRMGLMRSRAIGDTSV